MMKHLIIFLNFAQSRIDHPVYRLFAAESPYRRRGVTLLFLPKPLEERELLHEVSELRRKRDSESDVTFHLCATLGREGDAGAVVSTARLVRAHFAPDGEHRHGYPIFAYCLAPDVRTCAAHEVQALWRGLVTLNQAAADYADVELLRTVFLHTDASQRRLADYLYHATRVDLGGDYLRLDCNPMADGAPASVSASTEALASVSVMQAAGAQAPSARPTMPRLFGTFCAAGVAYPEQETRIYLHQCYLRAVLCQGLAEHNPIAMERCHAEAQRILAAIPLATERLCLQAEAFLHMGDEGASSWTPAADYWQCHLAAVSADGAMRDIPRDDWFRTLRGRAELHYQGKFRGMGVDFFFGLQRQRTEAYARALAAILREQIGQTARTAEVAFTPEAMKGVVRAVVNLLQQKVLELEHLQAAKERCVAEGQRTLQELEERWASRSIFSRLGGRDAQALAQYTQSLSAWMADRTWMPGFDFGIKLLNELIPLTAALVEPYDALQHTLGEALGAVQAAVADNDPMPLYGIFASDALPRAVAAIEADTAHLRTEYRQTILVPQTGAGEEGTTGNEDFLTHLRTELLARADAYIDGRIAAGTLPPVLGLPVTDRLDNLYRAEGGIRHYVGLLRQQATLTLPLKASVLPQAATERCLSGPQDLCILIGPTEAEVGEEVIQRPTDDISRIHLLHVLVGARLTDLDGFAGQRMFVEPSIF